LIYLIRSFRHNARHDRPLLLLARPLAVGKLLKLIIYIEYLVGIVEEKESHIYWILLEIGNGEPFIVNVIDG